MIRRFVSSLVVVLTVVMFLISAASAQSVVPQGTAAATASSEEHRNAERIAQVFGGILVDHFDGQFNFQRSPMNDWINGIFEMKKVGDVYMVTYLEVMGQVIIKRGDKPIGGLPTNQVGETRNFNLWLSGLDAHGQFVSSGSFFTDLLNSGDPIVVQLEAASVRVVVQFEVPKGVDQNNLRLVTSDGNIARYNSYIGGFEVYVDPTRIPTYQIMDSSTRIVYQEGTLDTLAKNPVKAEEVSVVGLQLPEGVVEVPLTAQEPYLNLEEQELDGQVTRPCTPVKVDCTQEVPAKVYLVRLDKRSLYVELYGSNSDKLKIEVRKWVARGDMPLIIESKTGPYTYVQVPTGYDTVVVTVLPIDPKVPVPTPLNLSVFFSRF